MLFAKLLDRLRGKRRASQPPIASPAARPYRAPTSPPPENEAGGFDPYNSGSFNAKPWERIKRR